MRFLPAPLIWICLAVLVSAQDPPAPSVEEASARLKRALEQEKALSPETRAALRDLADAVKAPSPPTSDAGEPSTWETLRRNLKIYGDFRLRGEWDFRRDDRDDRHRGRIRLRPKNP